MKILKFNLICLVILITAITCFSQTPTLSVRNAHSMVYDQKNKRVLLFGGADEKQVYSDLWELRKNGWKLIETDLSPEARTFASFVYDKKNRRAVLFGGNKVLFGNKENPTQLLNDTWELKGRTWKKLETINSPPPRAEGAIAYDLRQKRIILFGGYNLANGKVEKLNDTWELKGRTWKKLNEGEISARNGATMAFDARLKKLILFGGSTVTKDYGEKTGETWMLENDNWRKLEIDQPANVFNSNMLYHTKSKRIYRFGGWNGKGRINETWIFKNKQWTKLNLNLEPPARNHSAMVYDSKAKHLILFGGHDGTKIFGDLWIFKGGKWYKEFEHPPIKRISNGH